MNGGESKHFNASFPVEGHDGVFLSQRLHATKDGNIEVVDRKAFGCALDDKEPIITRARNNPDGSIRIEEITEQAAWDEAVASQQARWNKLPADLANAAQAKDAVNSANLEEKKVKSEPHESFAVRHGLQKQIERKNHGEDSGNLVYGR
jgi:hypothetical protein